MRWTPVIVLMSEDLVEALEDDVHDCETRLNADDELSELWQRNGWDPRMMAYGLVYQQYVAEAQLRTSMDISGLVPADASLDGWIPGPVSGDPQ